MTPKRKYFTADIPSDCETDPNSRFELAILQAKDHFTDFVIPCNWRLLWDSGEQVRIVRESNSVTCNYDDLSIVM